MRIAENTVVAIDYTLTDDDGQVLDTSEGRGPLSYLHGRGGIIPGLERALHDKQVGDRLVVAVPPEEGYGERNEALRQDVPRGQFAEIEDLELGMQFKVDTNAGPLVITIVEIAEDVITIDGNHSLAGVNLNFAVTVRDVRTATEDELAHGHVHGPGGHSH